MNREVARCSAMGNMHDARYLLRTLAVLYWGMAGCIALALSLLAPLIAGYWLQTINLSPETVMQAVMLMGVAIACRWPIGLYQGTLMGAQRLAISSGINMVMITLANFGAIGILAWVSPSIQAFFLWHAGISLLHALIIRRAAWDLIGRSEDVSFSLQELKRVWHFSAGMSGVAIAALILTQLDKLILSRIINLEDFGRYTLAGVVAGSIYVLITPVFNSIYPRFTVLVKSQKTDELAALYRLGTRTLTVVLFPAACAVAYFAQDLIFVWTGNAVLSASAAPIVGLLTIGTSINGAMHFPYALQLAYGTVWIPFANAVTLLIIFVPLITILANSYGATGGATAWLTLNMVYLFLGTWLTHRYLLKGIGIKWLLQDIGMPLLVSLMMMQLGEYIVTTTGIVSHSYARLFCGLVLTVLTIMLLLAFSPHVRSGITTIIRRKRVITENT
jgi:O-antigen/teichoic acid export membrane protein